MTDVIYLAIVVVCLVISAFFSSSETALFRLRSHEIDKEVESARGPTAVAVRDLISSSSRLLVTILLGNNVVNILGASAASALALSYFGPQVGILVSTAVMTVLVLILCEVLPKAVAARHPLAIARVIGLPLYIFHAALRPVHSLFDRIIEPVVRRITSTSGDLEETQSAEDVLRLARDVREGDEPGSPIAIMGATSEAAEMDVTEIMVPRTEIDINQAGDSRMALVEGNVTLADLVDGLLPALDGTQPKPRRTATGGTQATGRGVRG